MVDGVLSGRYLCKRHVIGSEVDDVLVKADSLGSAPTVNDQLSPLLEEIAAAKALIETGLKMLKKCKADVVIIKKGLK